MKRKLGINSDCLAGLSDELTTMELAKQIGFEAFTTNVYDLASVTALKEKADQLGVELCYLHAPFSGINNMWLEGEDYRAIYDGMITTIDSAAACGVPSVIVHVSSSWTPPAVNELGLSRYGRLYDYAAEKGVLIAMENLRITENLLQLKAHFEDQENLRFCFDCGHEHCCTPETDWLEIFGSKLIATHIHDNPGRSKEDPMENRDNHWLPFDGTYDYENMIRRMDKIGYAGPLILEVFRKRRSDYEPMTAEEYLTTCYQRLKKISEM